MTVFFVDGTGERCWEDFRSARGLDLDTLTQGDLCFIHLSDFQKLVANERSGMDRAKWIALSGIRDALAVQKHLGRSRNAYLVFISGERSVDEPTQRIIRERLVDHDNARIGFYPGVHRFLTGLQLERLLGPLVDIVGCGCADIQSQIARVLTASEAAQTGEIESRDRLLAFRVLWQLYVLARTGRDLVPAGLLQTKDRLEEAKVRDECFGKNYWQPVLEGEHLSPIVVKNPGLGLSAVVARLQEDVDWEHLGVDTLIVDYRDVWFKGWR